MDKLPVNDKPGVLDLGVKNHSGGSLIVEKEKSIEEKNAEIQNNNPFYQAPVIEKKKNPLVDILQTVVIALSITLFLYLFLIIPNQVDGSSMEPNFLDGQMLFTSTLHQRLSGTSLGDSLGFTYKRGDVVVFQIPGNADFIKRIIAEPGDTVAIEDGVYYINGQRLDEQYDLDNDQRRDGSFLRDGDTPVTVPANSYFVSGDHRDVSQDSRAFGFVRKDWIKGKVILRIWPPDSFGIIGAGKSELVEE